MVWWWWSHIVVVLSLSVVGVSRPLFQSSGDHITVTVSTYNLWNVMFNWDVRKYRIAQMIRESNPDVIGFQEIRSDLHRNQLSDLQQLLPNHKWKAYLQVQNVKREPQAMPGLGWEIEGLGILSRHPIINYEGQQLSLTASPDKNKRQVLHAQVKVAEFGLVHVAVVHLSYDKRQQCDNVADIGKYIEDGKFPYSVIMGDFNAYKDFGQPVQRLLNGQFSSSGGCHKSLYLNNPRKEDAVTYTDAWVATNPNENGFTFSNMPTPGLESRPDRILVSSKSLQVRSAKIVGDGVIYKRSFSSHISWNRFTTVWDAAYNSYYGASGKACYHDCGPHGSCRCGVCVAGGNKEACLLPDCSECNADVYFYFVAMSIVFFLCLVQFLYASLQILFILNQKNQRLMESMGINCCLFYPGLYTSSGNPHRSKWKVWRIIARLWPFCRMPAFYQVTSCGVLMVTIIVIGLYMFQDTLSTMSDILPEEYFPSDHRMLTAILGILKDGPLIQAMDV
ncbi:uncharacterized protein LOC144440131 [Glandiceps talaboti]